MSEPPLADEIRESVRKARAARGLDTIERLPYSPPMDREDREAARGEDRADSKRSDPW